MYAPSYRRGQTGFSSSSTHVLVAHHHDLISEDIESSIVFVVVAMVITELVDLVVVRVFLVQRVDLFFVDA
jgi:hypothetical protein